MWRALALTAVLFVLFAPGVGATERTLSEIESYNVSTYRGWVLWDEAGSGSGSRPVLWRGNSRRALKLTGTIPSGHGTTRLGSDSRGRSVVVYMRCAESAQPGAHAARDCELVRHRLVDGADNALLRAAEATDIMAPELSDGRLFLGRTDPTRPGSQRSTYMVRPGARTRRLSLDAPSALDVVGRRVVYAANREGTGSRDNFGAGVVRAIDLGARRPTYRTLAKHDNTDVDGRVGGFAVVSHYEAATDGRYAYWLRETLRDSLGESTWEVMRADLADAEAPLSSLPLENSASSLAVGKDRLYYTGKYSGSHGVFEVTAPAWQPVD